MQLPEVLLLERLEKKENFLKKIFKKKFRKKTFEKKFRKKKFFENFSEKKQTSNSSQKPDFPLVWPLSFCSSLTRMEISDTWNRVALKGCTEKSKNEIFEAKSKKISPQIRL
jgi:hypothetical protein